MSEKTNFSDAYRLWKTACLHDYEKHIANGPDDEGFETYMKEKVNSMTLYDVLEELDSWVEWMNDR